MMEEIDPKLFSAAVAAFRLGERTLVHGGARYSLYFFVHAFWDNKEPLPSELCQVLNLPDRSSYSDGARVLKKALLKRA